MADARAWIDLAAGDEFAGYRIERALGRGGMGILYLAQEPGLERRVALKLIAPEAAADEVFSRRFAEESRIAASIEHPNVVPIYAAGEERGVPYIAMRYVSGADLGRRLAREGRLDPSLAVRLIAQVGNGLDAIHAAGLVHRDVKPANVLLSGATEDDHAYITDFGVARNVATESGLTQTGRFVGTLDYVAPEQVSGGSVDARADVYALGCLLFKLLTGEVPFQRDGDAAKLYAHLNDPPPAPSLHAANVPIALDKVVERAMSKAPGDRYPSAGDLGRAAVAALSGERSTVPEWTVATGAAATREMAMAQRRPNRGALAVGLAAAAVVAVVAIAVAIGGGGGGEGDDGPGPAATGQAASSEPAADPKPTPQTLTRSELTSRADAVCERSKDRYGAMRDAEREYSADVEYAEDLVEMAEARIAGLRRLAPPRRLAGAYDRYVVLQERVLATDRQALVAARRGDAAGVAAARDRRDSEDELRERLAREIGLEVCSVRQG